MTLRALFPWLYDIVMGVAERTSLADWRRSVVRDARGTVLEIAAGTGLNFRFYDPKTFVIGTDVDLHMLRRAQSRARRAPSRMALVVADAEALPFRAMTFDSAVVGLALCTVPSPGSALRELHRVLRGDGAMHLLEHVRVGGIVGRLQDWLTPAWRHLAGGCHLNRQTIRAVLAAGFAVEEVLSHAGGVFVEIGAVPRQGSPGVP